MSYTKEFRVEAVRLYRESGKPMSEAAGDIGVAASSLAKWERHLDIDSGRGRDLVKQAALLYRIACRLIDVCEKEIGAKQSDKWTGRDVVRAQNA